ncbi:MAG: ribonuclease [Rhodoferax sp.]|nr:ribonuclease [Rhodoferax sp.]
MAALTMARAHGARVVRLHCDNSIVVAELAGTAARPMARLGPLFDAARALAALFERVSMVWIPRHRNAEADALARAAVGLAPKPLKPLKPLKPRQRRGR